MENNRTETDGMQSRCTEKHAQLNDPLDEAVKNLFGLSYLFPYQRLVITNILEAASTAQLERRTEPNLNGELTNKIFDSSDDLTDRETSGKQIVILPTGAGKSLCFQLPAMMIDGITLVIYPILSLMADQQRRLNERGFSPVTLRGEQSKEEREEIWEKLESGKSRFIIANPEILLTEQIKKRIGGINITHIVIDEAHCVSEWGETFRPSYLELNSIIKSINPPLITAFTATASAPVLEKIKKYIFGDIEARQIVGNPDRPNISYNAMGCINRDLAVRDLLIANSHPAIVFCSSRPGTEKLAHYLRNEIYEMGFDWHDQIRFYHAGLTRSEKTNIEKWLLHNTEAVLCSTCAFGMGVDKADVRTVIHRDCPPSVEAYLQESGRAGRDGKQSMAYLLWGPDDDRALERSRNSNNRIEKDADYLRLSAVINYARNNKNCRRHALLALMNYDSGGEVPEKNCCDVCEGKSNNIIREESSVLNFFKSNKRRFTQNEASSVLAANTTVRWSEEEASRTINYLIKTNKLKRKKFFPWKDKITVK